MAKFKKCPACAEKILADANKCKHCGENVAHVVPEKKKMGCLMRGCLGYLCFVLVMSVFRTITGTEAGTSLSTGSTTATYSSTSSKEADDLREEIEDERAAKEAAAEEKAAAEQAAREAAEAALPKLKLTAGEFYTEHGYFIYEGEVKNVSSEPIDNLQAVATFVKADGSFVKSDSAMVDYQPLLPKQSSPFKVMATENPAGTHARIEFKTMFGGTIDYQDVRPK